jgi:nitronate monooxygenase
VTLPPVKVVAAPMAGGPTTPALVAAVSNAGGLGILAGGYKAADAVVAEITETRRGTTRAFGLNLFVPGAPTDAAVYCDRLRAEGIDTGVPRWDDDDWDAKLQAAEGVPVVTFTFGCPSREVVDRLRSSGSAVVVTVTTPDEADRAGDVDGLLLQGAEAGGHRGSWADDEDPPLPLLELLAVTRDDVPRWAAGGLMTRADVDQVLGAGAAAAVLGTAFLLCPEAGTGPTHRAALQDPRFTETALTRAFTGRTARGLVNGFLREHPDAPRGYPEIHHVTRPMRQRAAAEGDADRLHLWAGTGWQLARAVPAAQLVADLTPPPRPPMIKALGPPRSR